jgi:hypothetical protein
MLVILDLSSSEGIKSKITTVTGGHGAALAHDEPYLEVVSAGLAPVAGQPQTSPRALGQPWLTA